MYIVFSFIEFQA